jgi:hypothetical protein
MTRKSALLALGLIKFVRTIAVYWSHFAVQLKPDLEVQQTNLNNWDSIYNTLFFK